jgi:hypothetical protein
MNQIEEKKEKNNFLLQTSKKICKLAKKIEYLN